MNGKFLSYGLVLAVGMAAGLLAARSWRGAPPATDKSPTAATGGVVAAATEPSRKSTPKAPARDEDGEVRALSAAEAVAGQGQSQAVSSVLSSWSSSDPQGAAAWVATFPEGKERESGISSVVRQWAQNDAFGAADWLKTLPAGQSRENAVGAYVDSISYQFPETAVQWAASIADDQQRNYRLQNAARQWLQQDERAAEAWIRQGPFTDDARSRLLRDR